ncbi:PAS domain S-box protein [Aneurinibacillus sp. REN35]|uniref:PAS domain S-box protein n=1 Tax=Aneurinibacillus sp. REN35 TaxID=3237286 RepID=UPI0035292FFC
MLRELFINIAVLVSLLFAANHFFERTYFQRLSKRQLEILTGVTYGCIGIVLLAFHFEVKPGIFIDMRHLPIMLASLYGGLLPAFIAGVVMGFTRLVQTGIEPMALIGFVNIVVVSLVCVFLSRFFVNKWVGGLVLMLYIFLQNVAIFFSILTDITLVLTASMKYWVMLFLGGTLSLYVLDYVQRSNDLVRLLKATKEQLESFIEHSADAIVILGMDRSVQQVNASFEKMYGWEEEELIGRQLPLILQNAQEQAEKIFAKVKQGESIAGQEMEARRKDGSVRNVFLTISPIKDGEEVIGISIISRDITERKKHEEALRKSEAKYRYITENTSDLIVVMTTEGMIQYASPSHETVLGCKPSEIEGEPRPDLLPIDELFNTEKKIEEIIKTKKEGELEFHIQNKKGEWRLLEAYIKPVLDVVGQVESLVMVSRDVTEKKRTEELLQQSDKLSMIGEMAAGIAHEIRNPLTTLKGFVQLMKSDMQHSIHLDLMFSELERIEMITNELLVLAKPQVSQFKQKDIASLLDSVVMLLSTQAVLYDIEIEARYEQIPLVICEENHLKQVFINIIKNAIEAMTEGGRITIDVRREDAEQIRISIADEGCGIPKERMAKLGEPFYTLKEKGTGLGLMICYKFIKEHGGQLFFESEVGRGTLVTILLPIDGAKTS